MPPLTFSTSSLKLIRACPELDPVNLGYGGFCVPIFNNLVVHRVTEGVFFVSHVSCSRMGWNAGGTKGGPTRGRSSSGVVFEALC